MRHKDRVAIVTGGGSGIGRGICEYMAGFGGKMVVADIDLDAARQVVEKIKGDGGEAMALKVDVTSISETRAMAAEVLKAYGQIDILVNNAGTDKKGAITELEESTYHLFQFGEYQKESIMSILTEQYGKKLIIGISYLAV